MIKQTEQSLAAAWARATRSSTGAAMSIFTIFPATPATGCTSIRWPAKRPLFRPPTSMPKIISEARASARLPWTVRASVPSAARLRDARNRQPVPDSQAIESHLGLFKYGGIDIEGLINFDKVPNGALFIGLPVKHAHSPTAETRAVAITDPELSVQCK
jgi:hypothetical protein